VSEGLGFVYIISSLPLKVTLFLFLHFIFTYFVNKSFPQSNNNYKRMHSEGGNPGFAAKSAGYAGGIICLPP
jgi:hypothetical protein